MVAKKLLDRREGEIAQGKVPGVHFDKVTFDENFNSFMHQNLAQLREKEIQPVVDAFIQKMGELEKKYNLEVEKNASLLQKNDDLRISREVR